jgi:dTDP-4-dehydrorhamnose reductase
MKILVTGSNGQLGSEIKNISEDHIGFEWIFSDIKELDLSKLDELKIYLNNTCPDIIINCAAYTAVDKAESNFKIANIINNKSVDLMSLWAYNNDCKFIHISTDYVFDGNSSTSLNENAETSPINVYGKTKLFGENACLYNNPNSIIIRTSWVYSSYGNNFVKTMMKLMNEKNELNVVSDQIGSPTYALDLANIIMQIICSKNWFSGLYHFSNDGEISWLEFAEAIKTICGFSTSLNSVSSENFPTIAKRPKFSLLDKTKIIDTYDVKIPHYLNSLKKCINILKSNNYE